MDALPLVPFEEARAYFSGLLPMLEGEFAALAEEIRRRAFTVANVTAMDALLEIYNALDDAMANGLPFSEFQAQVLDLFERRGWIGPNPWHLDTVFQDNIQSAYGAGRLSQHAELMDLYPYGEYIDVGDHRVRAHHRALRGQIHHMNSEFWRIHYPPWEHRCRCSCIPRSREEVRGRKIFTDDGPAPRGEFQGPAYGFDFGDPSSAVKILMQGAPKWAKDQVVNTLEDPDLIARSKKLFGL